MPPILTERLYQTRSHGGAPARLIQNIYKVDPLICPQCGHEMKVLAVITDPHEVQKILECLKRNKEPPFDKVALKVSWFSFPYTSIKKELLAGEKRLSLFQKIP